MVGVDSQDAESIPGRLARQSAGDALRVTLHAHQEMVAEDISYESLREALSACQVVENYPDHRRGPCGLVCGRSAAGRSLHIVCTTTLPVAVIITVYEPVPPKWIGPVERGKLK